MGHIVNPDREYRLLQHKLDRQITSDIRWRFCNGLPCCIPAVQS